MLEDLTKGYATGTHRLVSPEQTLERIQPHLAAMGISRCADVTGLDEFNIPVYCAIRPPGRVLQVSNGKGLQPMNAKVSALMEAIEIYHAENPNPDRLRRTSLAKLQDQGEQVLSPLELPEYTNDYYFSSDYVSNWVLGKNLQTGEAFWISASAVYLNYPCFHGFSANGLASGNHRMEATLHALYEVIERDALSRISQDGRLKITQRCRVVDLETLNHPEIQSLHENLKQAGVKLVLLWMPSSITIHTFWAVILDANAFSAASMVNIGYGTHLNPAVAASRAITEAAQSRLTVIHGSREDMHEIVYQEWEPKKKLLKFFDQLPSQIAWQAFADLSKPSLQQDYETVLNALLDAGYDRVLQVDLTCAPFHIPVVKVIVPGLKINRHLI